MLNSSPDNCEVVIGFDYGERRIGVAVGNRITGLARGIATLAVANNQPDWGEIQKLIDTWAPDQLIVGLPKSAEETSSTFLRTIRRFGRRLESVFKLPVQFVNEELSTQEAMHQLATHSTAMRRLKLRDQVAAKIIVETWLNSGNTLQSHSKGAEE